MKALLLIDLQNDYFPGGKFPLWNAEGVLATVEKAVSAARAKGVLVVHVQHVADPDDQGGVRIGDFADFDQAWHRGGLRRISPRRPPTRTSRPPGAWRLPVWPARAA